MFDLCLIQSLMIILKPVSRRFFNSSLLATRFPFKYGKFLHIENNFPSIKHYLKLVYDKRNAPSGYDSDRCLEEILNECKLSDTCLKVELADRTSFGYSSTHKFVATKFNIKRFKLFCSFQTFVSFDEPHRL